MPQTPFQVAQKFRAELLKREAAATMQMQTAYALIQQRLEKRIVELQTQIQGTIKAGKPLTPVSLMRLSRLNVLLQDTEAQLNLYGRQAASAIQSAQADAVSLALDSTKQILLSQNYKTAFTGLQPRVIAAMQAQWSPHSPVREIFSDLSILQKKKFIDTLVQGVALGLPPRQIAEEMHVELGTPLVRSFTVARTETLRAYREASRAASAQAGVVAWRWTASKSVRTCLSCLALDGRLFEVKKPFPAHPNCRCVMIMLAPGMPPPQIQQAGQWFEQQPDDIKRRMMGNAAFEAYQKGEVKLGHFSGLRKDAKWGDMRYELSLKKALEAAKSSSKPQVDRLPRTLSAKTITKAPADSKAPVAPTLPADPFPQDIAKLVEVRALGGSTGAKLVRDPVTGNQFVLKRGASADHLREEGHADKLYAALGVRVPEHRLYETSAGPVKLSQFIEGKTLASLSGDALEAAHAQLREHFAADSLLGNWDVVGLSNDNILVGNDGKAWRIDNGGSLRFRAQGAQKSASDWNQYPVELWTLRDAKLNVQTAKVFGQLSIYDIRRQIENLREGAIRALPDVPDELKNVLTARIAQMRYLAQTTKTFEDDLWKADYVDGFTKQIIGLRKAGIVDKLPNELKQEAGEVSDVRDEQGRKFDNLRGASGIMKDVIAYFSANGGEHKLIYRWAGAQAGSSWSMEAQAVKEFFMLQRNVDKSEYYIHVPGGTEKNYASLLKIKSEEMVRTSWQIQHALTYELLGKTQMRYNDREARVMRLIRTEQDFVLKQMGIQVGPDQYYKRGAHESASLFKVTFPFGKETTIQNVPHHRITGSYLFSRGADDANFYLSDGENEFTFLPQGIKFEYLGTRKTANPGGGLNWKAGKENKK